MQYLIIILAIASLLTMAGCKRGKVFDPGPQNPPYHSNECDEDGSDCDR